MSQPPAYSPTTDFSDEEASGVSGRSTVRTAAVDTELANIATTIAAIRTNLAIIQRDDGHIRDLAVDTYNLTAAVLTLIGSAGFNLRGTWLTATAYAVKDMIRNATGTGTYVCIVAHTSGTFSTDLAAGKWTVIFDSAAYVASGVAFTPTGSIGSTDVQAAIAEVASEALQKTSNLSDLNNVVTARANLGTFDVLNVVEGRLTLTSGTPVTTGDVTAAETLYFTPYKGNKIALFDGTNWNCRTFTELSIDIPDATNCYDVFAYDNAGAAALELTAWTNETTRATALTTQNGVLSKTGALTRRYLGSFYSTTAGNGQVEDSLAKRNLWNYYNRVRREMRRAYSDGSWAYTLATLRQAAANAANQLEFVIGFSEDIVEAEVHINSSDTSAAVTSTVGIGLDSTTADSAVISIVGGGGANQYQPNAAFYKGCVAVGRHLLVGLEKSAATGTMTWYGTADSNKAGMTGTVWG